MLHQALEIVRSHGVIKKILVANDGSERALEALSIAIDIALRFQAELHMLIVEELPRFPISVADVTAELESARHDLAPLITSSKHLAEGRGLILHCHSLPGRPVRTTVSFAHDRAFDLVVVGLARHSTLYHWLFGSFAERLVERASCPVLVVK